MRRTAHRALRPDEKSKGPPDDGVMFDRERVVVTTLCAIYALRILGMYLVLPILSPYAHGLRGSTSLLTGMSLGAYGLTQALFQLPFGRLSDRIGRKRAIGIGLVVFALGSVLCGVARDIYLLIAGRLLQGAGAVAAAVVALVADLTRPAVRTQAMARIGVWLGASLTLGMIAGPALAVAVPIPALFWGTAAAALLSALLLAWLVPTPGLAASDEQLGTEHLRMRDLGWIVAQRPLVLLCLGSALLHLSLTAIFVLLPYRMEIAGETRRLWIVTGAIVSFGIVVMLVVSRWADRRRRTREAFLGGGLGFVLACFAFALAGGSLGGAIAATALFIAALGCLEPALPALTSRFAAGPHRGSAIGIFHTAQFLGSFLGGVLGGAFLKADLRPLFLALAVLAFAWWLAVAREPRFSHEAVPSRSE